MPEKEAKKTLPDYFQTRNLMGNMEPALQKKLFGKVQQKEVWQLVAKQNSVKPNTVYYKRVMNPQSKLKEFAFIVTHLATQKRKFVLYCFSNTEFVYEEDAPDNGDIMAVNKNY